MFINFYSIILKKDTLNITGYTEYLEKYFIITVKIISPENIENLVSSEEKVIVKGGYLYYLIESTFFDHFIESKIYQRFDYKKYNIPSTVYLMIISLLNVRL